MRFITEPLLKALRSLLRFIQGINPFNKNPNWTSLTVLPGIGNKNGQLFFDAGYRTPQDILKATDAELLEIPGVGYGFLKRLRDHR
tara:strand:+ start:426 stop:683 length:258 start_codon:yes stop_codon:yes gene_type:complete